MSHAGLVDRCRELALVLCDVDGVMTDGSLLFGPDGTELKSLNVRDGLGIVLAHHAGLQTGLVSGRSSEPIARRAAELGMAVIHQGVVDKAAALAQILDQQRLSASQVAYMGDDLNDLPVMRMVGLSAAPGDAPREVRERAHLVTRAAGGRGCLREFLEIILRNRGAWEGAVSSLGVSLDE
jgi:3-deoxy-D-manno-octulosonate 8-phosphate phosphatase (KDO 8-P phosphatase)